jgi:DNA-binding transcriptional MerR regulator
MTSKPLNRSGACWRIDDLARRAEVTVDTIRYYQREGLMPPGERSGRLNLYGPEHLERLERIKELQGRRFSLAACRALLEDHREALVAGIFADTAGGSYTFEELVDRAQIDSALAADLHDIGLLRDPTEYGRDAYDSDDLEVLRTMAELARLGIPHKGIVELARIYAEGIEATQREVVELFTTGGDVDWEHDELTDFQNRAGDAATEILPRARRIVDYTHHRTIQRLALGAIERGVIKPLSSKKTPDDDKS